MKIRKSFPLVCALLFVSCNSNVEFQPIHLKPTSTLEHLPIGTEISCEPVSNPFPTPSGNADSFQYNPNIEINRVCTFTGHVSRNQTYKHQITHDLVFCLVPSGIMPDVFEEGWTIVISDTRPGSCDFGSENYVNFGPIVAPPFRGNLFFDVYGWHFRNENNTGVNDESVNSPQEERYFNFLFNRKDYEKVWYAARCSQWAIDADCAMATQTSMNVKITEIPRSRAKFTITELELGNLNPNSHAWIEHMEFKVDVYLSVE